MRWALALWTAVTIANAASPEVLKVEPPNWWAGHSINPVRVLLRGKNLCGVRVNSKLRTSRITTSASCTSLFVDINIPAKTQPGDYPLTLVSGEGKTSAPFSISAPLDAKGRFQGFSTDDVMYLIMPDRFANGDKSNDGDSDPSHPRRYHGGDLQGVIHHLPYLKELGITAIWLNPVYDSSDYHGYHAVDFYAVEEHFGDMPKFRELVDAAHRHGIKVIQDQVANHTGPRHPWVADPPTPTWFHGTAKEHLNNTFQTWTLIDPYASDELRRATLDGWFVNRLPDLNQDDVEVRRYLIQNTLWWIGMTGLDGIRQDTVPYVPRAFWRDWMAVIKRQYPSFRVVGEVLDRDPVLVSFFENAGIDTLFDFPLYFAVRRAFAEGKRLRDVPEALAHDRLYANASALVTLLGLHDVPRFMHVPGATIEGLKLAYTFMMTTRGTPLIYYGDEIAMPGGDDPDNRRDFPGTHAGDTSVQAHVRALARLRRELEPLRRGRLQHHYASDQQYVFSRETREYKIVVALNNDIKDTVIDFAVNGITEGNFPDSLGSSKPLRTAGGRARVELRPRSGAIFVLRLP